MHIKECISRKYSQKAASKILPMQPSSRHVAAALRAVQGLQVLLCGGKVQPSLARLAVLLVELRFFRNKRFSLGF